MKKYIYYDYSKNSIMAVFHVLDLENFKQIKKELKKLFWKEIDKDKLEVPFDFYKRHKGISLLTSCGYFFSKVEISFRHSLIPIGTAFYSYWFFINFYSKIPNLYSEEKIDMLKKLLFETGMVIPEILSETKVEQEITSCFLKERFIFIFQEFFPFLLHYEKNFITQIQRIENKIFKLIEFCINEIKKVIGQKISKKQYQKIVETINNNAERINQLREALTIRSIKPFFFYPLWMIKQGKTLKAVILSAFSGKGQALWSEWILSHIENKTNLGKNLLKLIDKQEEFVKDKLKEFYSFTGPPAKIVDTELINTIFPFMKREYTINFFDIVD